MTRRIVLAEDSVLLREGLIEILQRSGNVVVAAIGRADEVVPAVEAQRPDLLVTDVRMPPHTTSEDGLAAALTVRDRWPGLPVLVLSQYVATAYATDLLSHPSGIGGLGYLLKQRVSDLDGFRRSLDQVAGGGTVVDPDVLQRVLVASRDRSPIERLTTREREVLALVAAGRTNAQIAAELFVTEASIVKHLGNIFDKLDLGADAGNRRVLAVLVWLSAAPGPTGIEAGDAQP